MIKGIESERLGVIHVSDLIKECMRYSVYNKIKPMGSSDTQNIRPLYLGQSIHNNSMMASKPEWHEMFLAYNYISDTSLSYEECKLMEKDDPRWLDIVLGSVDDLREIDGEIIVCDKKTTGSIGYFENMWKRGQFNNESYKLQTSIYALLLEKCYGIQSKWGCNIFYPTHLEKGDKEKIIPIAYKLKNKDDMMKLMVDNALIIKDAMSNKNLPERTRNFLCDGMCPHATYCFEDDRKKWDEVLL